MSIGQKEYVQAEVYSRNWLAAVRETTNQTFYIYVWGRERGGRKRTTDRQTDRKRDR